MSENNSEGIQGREKTLNEKLFESFGRILVSRTISRALQEGRSDLYPVLKNISIIPDGELANYTDEGSQLELSTFMLQFGITEAEVNEIKRDLGLIPKE